MVALAKDRDTARKDKTRLVAPMAANIKIYAGSLMALDASGDATPGATATTLKSGGRALEQVDNTGGAAGDLSVPYEKGVFRWANSAAADEITRADIGNDCYIVDDQTVAKTDGTGTRSVAGKVVDLDATGVWVEFA